MKILVTDPIAEEGLEILKSKKRCEVSIKTKLSPEELVSLIGDYEALIIRSDTKVTKEVIEAGKRLKVIGRAGEGVDNIDLEAATKRGIIVMNTPGVNTISAAEHAISLLLSLSRNIPQANTSLKGGKWERGKFQGVEVYNKLLGIIGLGKVGRHVGKRAQGLGMKIIAYDPHISEEPLRKEGIELVDLKELFSRSDYITIHTPLSKETEHLIGEKEFHLMKEGVRIINCARGGIIDEPALYKAIKSGKVAGAALDVFEKEPPLSSPLLSLKEVIATPHLGASTQEAQEKVAKEIAGQVIDALSGKIVRNAVNIPSIDGDILEKVQPYLSLVEGIGRLLGQVSPGRIQKIEASYSGEVLDYNLAPITISLLKGLLDAILHEPVNFVNALVIAKERGIEVIESKTSERGDFSNLITVLARTDQGEKLIAGTLLSKNEPRIVQIDEFRIDATPSGFMLICSNVDKPGVIGKIGTVLGKHKINIAALQYGRKDFGGQAIVVLNVDNAVPKKVLEELIKVKEITEAKLVKL